MVRILWRSCPVVVVEAAVVVVVVVAVVGLVVAVVVVIVPEPAAPVAAAAAAAGQWARKGTAPFTKSGFSDSRKVRPPTPLRWPSPLP